MEIVENFLKDLAVSLQVARIYTASHPNFNEAIEKAYSSLNEVFSVKEELVIGFVGEELAFEKEIFFDLSKKLKSFIFSFKERSIERIIFRKGIDKKELSQLISYLVIPKEELTMGAQEYFAGLGIRNIDVGKINIASASDKGVSAPPGYLDIYEDCRKQIGQPFSDILEAKPLDYLSLKITMANIMENLTGRYQEFIKLTVVKKYDVVTFTHLLNVSILSLHFSSKLGFTKDDCLGIGIAGLFHDIGKLQISRSIIKKKDKLTEEEFMAVKSHTVLGAEILLGYVDSLGIQPAVVAFEHHLRYDNKGYPKLTFATKPHIGSSIVSICDVYDALIARRTYKRDYPPKMVYDLMMRERSGAFMPSLLDSFFRVMGVWPQGTIVELNTGDIAIVRQEQEEDIFSPLVEVVSSQKTGTFIDLKKEKDKITIERSLNPFSEGKQYISFL